MRSRFEVRVREEAEEAFAPETARRPMAPLRAVLFDVDGTLYRQWPVRCRVALGLARAAVGAPRESLAVVRALAAYRRAQERMRAAPGRFADLGAAQLDLAAADVGCDPRWLGAQVERWMERAPLPTLSAAMRPGLLTCLLALRAEGIRLAAVSDYPAADKLRALGVAELFDDVVSAQHVAVGRFKPHPEGIRYALRRLGVGPLEAAYVGDRPAVDGTAAAAAGVDCYVIGARRRPSGGASYRPARDFDALASALLARRGAR